MRHIFGRFRGAAVIHLSSRRPGHFLKICLTLIVTNPVSLPWFVWREAAREFCSRLSPARFAARESRRVRKV